MYFGLTYTFGRAQKETLKDRSWEH